MIKIVKKHIVFLLLLVLLAGMLVGCNSATDKVFQSLSDFEHAKIGVLTGSSQELIVKAKYPEAERVYFSRPADMVIAVEQGKIDGYMFGSPFLVATIWENANVKRVDEAVSHGDIAFAFPQDPSSDALREQLNTFLKQAKEDGTLEQLKDKWLGDTEPTEHPDYQSLTGENGTIRLAAVAENKPLIYQHQNQCTGLEMEILTHFAKAYGYRFDVEVVPFDSVIMGMATGKYDMTSASLQITPEREESVNFSDPYMQFDVVMVVKGDGKQKQTEKFSTLADLQHATLGIVTGTSWDIITQQEFPQAERKYFASTTDVILAMEQGKVDAMFADKTFYAGMRWESSNINSIDEPITEVSNALIFPKEGYDEKLLAQINAFIAQAKADGTLALLDEKWFGDTEPEEHPDYTKLTGENGTLRIAVGDTMKPTAYQKGSMYTGYEVDFLTLFAQEYGYQLEIQGMAFDALIPSVASRKFDIGACGITITPERAESVMFSDPHIETYGVAVFYNDTKNPAAVSQSVKTLKDVENGKFAILTGSIWDGVLQEQFPNAENKYFSSITDMLLALDQGKVDAILGDMTFYLNARWENAKVTVLDDTVGSISCGMIMAKDSYDATLLEQLNTFIGQVRADGTIDTLCDKWLGETEPTEHPDYTTLTGENGTIKVAVENAARPMTYQKNNGFTGFDVELLTMFAKEYGYRLEFVGMSFEALIPMISSGKCDIGVCGIAITEERAQSVTFTDCYTEIDGVVIVSQNTKSAPQAKFADKVAESFEKTFIREDRWKLIAEGIGVTMLISICSAIAGSALGFGLYMLSRSDVKLLQSLAKGIAKVYSRIIAGTPIVVILMILFYVVFGKFRDMSGILVAIIGFTLTFGAFVYDHMTVSVGSVDFGQTEAAYSLGYTKNKTFFRIIFPQAMTIFLPSYCGQAVELIKATAVVGYVAVNDLTKMGDIIRSNTYEAFFPLIATAVIYFLLTWILSMLLGLLKRHFEPKRRSKENILKGVKTV